MTEKLYEQDQYLKTFKAKVLSCNKTQNGFSVVLDKTAFFPEGGGQAADTGNLENATVFDVAIKNEIIYHYTDKPLETGDTVCGKIDFERRFSFMQNHTGEHIVSGVTHGLHGFNNVGFHLGEDFVTLDFDGVLTRTQLDEIEYLANEKVWQNLPVRAYYPSEQELKNISYRSKKEIDGAVRLVEIADTDICACCAPHVKNTGEIGIIKLLDFERMRGGVRILLKCGKFALNDYRSKYENVYEISNMLSAKQNDAAQAVELLNRKLNDEKHRNSQLSAKLCELIVNLADKNTNCLFTEGLSMREIQFAADKLHKIHGGIKGVFNKDKNGYSFAICGDAEILDEFFTKLKSELQLNGGGRNGMVQGFTNADADKIKMYF